MSKEYQQLPILHLTRKVWKSHISRHDRANMKVLFCKKSHNLQLMKQFKHPYMLHSHKMIIIPSVKEGRKSCKLCL